MSKISVLGIFVADVSFYGNKIPIVGETILGSSYKVGPGGKGCNQALAIARLGGELNFISKIGKDDYGQLAIKTLKQNNIDTSTVIQSPDHLTGVAGIMVDNKTGKNAINVITGAPSTFTISEVDKHIETIKKSKIFLTQLEIPKEVILHCLKIAKENNVITILNPAPAADISKEFFSNIDYFTPNETEAEFYTGIKITNEKRAKEASIKLLNFGLKKVIITLGEKGLFYSDGKEDIFIKALPLKKVIDTTGAGDAFNGGLAYALSQNKSIKESLNLANEVAGLSTLKVGAGNAMPELKDLS
jgi:ribokinase|tara:strand:+ start:1703 stop:2608 length:906 start_codon:yes stop_codon:yes gene_type:complete